MPSLSDPSKKQAIDQVRALGGVTILEGDLEAGVPALTAMLKEAKIQTVVSVVGGLQVAQQLPLVEAAKAAGVRHFIPSDFAFDTDAVPVDGMWGPYVQPKKVVQQAVRAAGLDYTRFFVGVFTEFLVTAPIAGVDLQRGQIAAPGSWEAKVNTTALDEVGWLVAAAVVDPQARNASVYCGESVSFKQLADLPDAVRGKPLERRIRTVEEAQQAIYKNSDDFSARLVGTVPTARASGGLPAKIIWAKIIPNTRRAHWRLGSTPTSSLRDFEPDTRDRGERDESETDVASHCTLNNVIEMMMVSREKAFSITQQHDAISVMQRW